MQPHLVVLHYTAMSNASAALQRLCDAEAEVSAHYLIGRDGTLWQMVAEEARAWHAGAGEWRGLDDINSRSIGIELDNAGDHPFSEPQMSCLEALLGQILKRWAIPPEAVIGHSDMAPGRKIDPGPRFDWARLARQGLAARSPVVNECAQAPKAAGDFQNLCEAAGYSAAASPEELLQALRLRHAPWRQGALCGADIALLRALSASGARRRT